MNSCGKKNGYRLASGFAKPRASPLHAEVPCNYIRGRLAAALQSVFETRSPPYRHFFSRCNHGILLILWFSLGFITRFKEMGFQCNPSFHGFFLVLHVYIEKKNGGREQKRGGKMTLFVDAAGAAFNSSTTTNSVKRLAAVLSTVL